jgi:hypothetical protein
MQTRWRLGAEVGGFEKNRNRYHKVIPAPVPQSGPETVNSPVPQSGPTGLGLKVVPLSISRGGWWGRGRASRKTEPQPQAMSSAREAKQGMSATNGNGADSRGNITANKAHRLFRQHVKHEKAWGQGPADMSLRCRIKGLVSRVSGSRSNSVASSVWRPTGR